MLHSRALFLVGLSLNFKFSSMGLLNRVSGTLISIECFVDLRRFDAGTGIRDLALLPNYPNQSQCILW